MPNEYNPQEEISNLTRTLRWAIGIAVALSVTLHGWSYRAFSELAIQKLDRKEFESFRDKQERKHDLTRQTLTDLSKSITRIEVLLDLLLKEGRKNEKK